MDKAADQSNILELKMEVSSLISFSFQFLDYLQKKDYDKATIAVERCINIFSDVKRK